MNARIAVLKQLVAKSSYPIDEAAIAEAIVVPARGAWSSTARPGS